MSIARHLKYAFFANTPLHVLNCLNMVWHDVEETRGNSILFVFKQFSGFDHMIGKIQDTGLFQHVYECKMPNKKDEGKLEHYIHRLGELLLPKRHLEAWTDCRPIKDTFDIIVMPAPLRFPTILYDVNRTAEVWFIEDGTVNYYGNILDHFGSKRKYLIRAFFNKGQDVIRPTRVYVNNAEYAHGVYEAEIKQLPRYVGCEKGYISFLRDVFGSTDRYLNKKIVYLSFPVEELDNRRKHLLKGIHRKTIESLSAYSEVTIVKRHPREREVDFYGLDMEEQNTLWEMLCLDSINDESILISYCSTAQFTPKYLFDKEPYLVFTYQLYHDLMDNEGRRQSNTLLVESLKKEYRNPEKIIVTETLEEYVNILNALIVQNK